MSTYRDLLLSTGGGVIGECQMDEQAACATIAIGLGGTGVDCLRNLYMHVCSRMIRMRISLYTVTSNFWQLIRIKIHWQQTGRSIHLTRRQNFLIFPLQRSARLLQIQKSWQLIRNLNG